MTGTVVGLVDHKIIRILVINVLAELNVKKFILRINYIDFVGLWTGQVDHW